MSLCPPLPVGVFDGHREPPRNPRRRRRPGPMAVRLRQLPLQRRQTLGQVVLEQSPPVARIEWVEPTPLHELHKP